MILRLHLSPGLRMIYPHLAEVLEQRPQAVPTTLRDILAQAGVNPLLIVAAESRGKVLSLDEPLGESQDIKLITHMGGG